MCLWAWNGVCLMCLWAWNVCFLMCLREWNGFFLKCVHGHGMVFDVFMGMEWFKKKFLWA